MRLHFHAVHNGYRENENGPEVQPTFPHFDNIPVLLCALVGAAYRTQTELGCGERRRGEKSKNQRRGESLVRSFELLA